VVSRDFSVTYSFRTYHGPGVDSAPGKNVYEENFLRVKVVGVWGWQPHYLHAPNVTDIWESRLPGTLWTTPDILRDSFILCYREGLAGLSDGVPQNYEERVAITQPRRLNIFDV